MKAVIISAPGGPEQLVWEEVEDVGPGPGEVLVRVTASAVNRADTLQRMGRYAVPPGATPILGLECSGTVDAVGADVTEWTVGDKVCALLVGGGYAEYVVVPAGQVLPIPSTVGLVDAAALPEAACTVWSNLSMIGRVKPGDDVLIHGGGSGIGTFAIQLVKALGGRALVTAGSPAKVARCLDLGAHVAIDYRQQDFVAEVHAATGGRGVNLILDNMGASYLARNLQALADDGQLITIGLQGGGTTEIDLSPMLRRRLSLHVTSLRSRSPEQKAAVVAQVREHVWPLVDAGHIHPVIDRALPMWEAADAHELLERSAHVGKILLVSREGKA